MNCINIVIAIQQHDLSICSVYKHLLRSPLILRRLMSRIFNKEPKHLLSL